MTLGALLPQSGDLSAIYKSLDTPVTMAVDEINAAGGVNDKPVVLKHADDGTSADVAADVARHAARRPTRSTRSSAPRPRPRRWASSTRSRTAGVVECSGSNTSAELSTVKDDGYYFRTAPPDTLQGPALAQLILQRRASTKVAILTRNDSYGTGFGDALETALKDGGADVPVNAAYDPAATDFKADVAKVVDTRRPTRSS